MMKDDDLFFSFSFLTAMLKKKNERTSQKRGVKRVRRDACEMFSFRSSSSSLKIKKYKRVCYSVRPPPASQSPDSSRHINMRKRTLAPASLYQTRCAPKVLLLYRDTRTLYTILYNNILSILRPPLLANPLARVGRSLRKPCVCSVLYVCVCSLLQLHDRRGSCSSRSSFSLFRDFFFC